MKKLEANMTEVSEERFFALLNADARDIMPSQISPDYTTWQTKDQKVWGYTSPGWKNPEEPKVYAVVKKAAA